MLQSMGSQWLSHWRTTTISFLISGMEGKPGDQATWGHTAYPTVKFSRPREVTQLTLLWSSALPWALLSWDLWSWWASLMWWRCGIHPLSDHNNTWDVWTFPCGDSTPLYTAWGRTLDYFKCSYQLIHWVLGNVKKLVKLSSGAKIRTCG